MGAADQTHILVFYMASTLPIKPCFPVMDILKKIKDLYSSALGLTSNVISVMGLNKLTSHDLAS